jgi:hypothetical protein
MVVAACELGTDIALPIARNQEVLMNKRSTYLIIMIVFLLPMYVACQSGSTNPPAREGSGQTGSQTNDSGMQPGATTPQSQERQGQQGSSQSNQQDLDRSQTEGQAGSATEDRDLPATAGQSLLLLLMGAGSVTGAALLRARMR